MDRHALNTSKHCALEMHHKHRHLYRYFNKTYTFVRNERYSEFLRLLGAEKMAESRATVERTKVLLREENGEYTWRTIYPTLKTTFLIKFRIHQPIEKQLSNGMRVVTRFEIDHNELIETQIFEDGKTVTVTRQFDDDQLVIIMELGNLRSHRFFVLDGSQHTICTETSRRRSFIEKRDEPRKILPSPLLSVQGDVSEGETTDQSDEICF